MKRVNQTRMESSNTGDGYCQDSVTLVTKGLKLEVVSILSLYTAVDFSSNRFEGHIPGIMGDLIALCVLNLSHNELQGHIPPSLENLPLVESLDLSSNYLVGQIPEQLTSLTFLQFLNLSHNQLQGCIPTGRQFATFENNSYTWIPCLGRLWKKQVLGGAFGDYWRKIRKIAINEVFSSSKLEKLRDVRVSEVKTSIKDLYSLFPITGDQNLDFPVTGDHFPVSGDNFPVGGDDVSFTVDGDEVNFLVTGDQSRVSGENLDFLVTGDHFPMIGDDFPVDGDDISFIVDGDNVIKPKKQP
ncbi:hypothetical protein CQW23_31782 [Capsicum baccatum]|uniref:Uncharacterized protein n=1 Tax=Capsicum baccatum TaxID=33114 RepID=A0A2G2V6S0_CAPBA|nr:hypothetical protein CQW23_31782 [Capsicum baccatum]